MSVQLSKTEKKALSILKISVNKKTLWGAAIDKTIKKKPKPEEVKELLKTITEQWQDNPKMMLKILGYFDLPKFLKQ